MSDEYETLPPHMLPRCPGADVIVVNDDGIWRAVVGEDGEIELEAINRETDRGLN